MIVTILIFLISLAVYAGYGIPGLAVLLADTLLAYCAGLLTKRFRSAMWISVMANVAMLLFFKGQHLAGLNIAAPLGVSYFALMLISYNVDVYRGKFEAEKSLFRFAACITYMPHLFMGPIEGYDTLAPNLFEKRRVSWDGISAGATRFAWGLFKKLVIAARAGTIIAAISADPEKYRGGYALVAMLLYSVQLYSDFSGGMDMVIGGSRILGVTLSENFDVPFLSESFREFWRRWHMTLGSWLRSYVYIPLGGNRKGNIRKVFNTVVTFLVSGLWHGVNYLLWGLFNGIFVAIGDRLKTPSKLLNRLGTFLLVSLLWCFYVWPETALALKMLLSVFTCFNYGELLGEIASMGLTAGDWMVFAVAVLLLTVCDCSREKMRSRFAAMAPWGRTAVCCLLVFLVLVFGMYGIGFNASEFIYSQF